VAQNADGYRTVRGGWYHAGTEGVKASDRTAIGTGTAWDGHGFRCVKAVTR
jgi:hypothetical protein